MRNLPRCPGKSAGANPLCAGSAAALPSTPTRLARLETVTKITDPDALLTPLKAQYGAFFAQPTRLPTDVVSPPVTAAPPLTKEDVRRMSQEDINRNWSSVCSVLSKGD